MSALSRRLQLFTTCPESRDGDLRAYGQLVRDVARDSEAAGATGILIYAENRAVDPWLVAQLTVQATERLSPLVAVQPIYAHPYTVAKLVSTIASLYDRRVYLNLVAGGFRNDLLALGDLSDHDDRYARLEEFGQIVGGLCRAGGSVTFAGRFYSVQSLRLEPAVPAGLEPVFTVSGSSPAGQEAAARLGAIPIRYPRPGGEGSGPPFRPPTGIRVGIIARPDREDAWRTAHLTFPADRRGQVAHGFAMKISDSHWHRQLSVPEPEAEDASSPYWLHPFRNYQTFCPYLVGSYAEVAAELTRYLDAGVDTVILDIMSSRVQELGHSVAALALARESA